MEKTWRELPPRLIRHKRDRLCLPARAHDFAASSLDSASSSFGALVQGILQMASRFHNDRDVAVSICSSSCCLSKPRDHALLVPFVDLVQSPVHVSSSFLCNRNNLLIICVSDSLLLSNACRLHDQLSNPKMNTLWTFSTIHLQVLLHGRSLLLQIRTPLHHAL